MSGEISSIDIYGDNFNAWTVKGENGVEDIKVYNYDFRLIFPKLKNTTFYTYFCDKNLTSCSPHQKKCYREKNGYSPCKMSLVSLKVAKRAFKYFKYRYKPRETTSNKQLQQPGTKAILPPPNKLLPAKSFVIRPGQSLLKCNNPGQEHMKKPNPPSTLDIPKPLTITPLINLKSSCTMDEIHETHYKALKCCRENIENLMRFMDIFRS